jgi:hypothetical protein
MAGDQSGPVFSQTNVSPWMSARIDRGGGAGGEERRQGLRRVRGTTTHQQDKAKDKKGARDVHWSEIECFHQEQSGRRGGRKWNIGARGGEIEILRPGD